jgi:hypothetical protein
MRQSQFNGSHRDRMVISPNPVVAERSNSDGGVENVGIGRAPAAITAPQA